MKLVLKNPIKGTEKGDKSYLIAPPHQAQTVTVTNIQQNMGGKERLYVCQHCNYKATKRNNLLKHVSAIHDGVKYPCTICNYKATQKWHLVRHASAIHDGIKFPCTDCDYKATTKSDLQRHIKSIHEGVKKGVLGLGSHDLE